MSNKFSILDFSKDPHVNFYLGSFYEPLCCQGLTLY